MSLTGRTHFGDRFGIGQGIPFDVKIPNATTRKAMNDAEESRTIKGFKNTDDLFRSLNS